VGGVSLKTDLPPAASSGPDIENREFSMAYRTESWDKEIAYQLQHDKVYAKYFVEKLVQEGADPLEVLRRVLRASQNAKEETLNKMAKPFGVKIRRELAFV
jgi:hypothetical protein